jgi:hypothetical protein
MFASLPTDRTPGIGFNRKKLGYSAGRRTLSMSMQDQLPPSEGTTPTAEQTAYEAAQKELGGEPMVVTAPPVTAGPSANDKTMGMLAHLLGIFLGPIGPLIIWLIQKDTSAFAGAEGKEALNFQITLLIGWVAAFLLSFVFIGFLLFPVLGLLALIFGIMGTMEANKGNHYKYPFALRLIQ